jgi:hypothetical protein
MSIESNDIDSSNQELSNSNSGHSNTSNIGTQAETISATQLDIDDDEDDLDEFKAMFMSNAYTSKSHRNYASTPLVRSQHYKQ